MDVLAKYLFCIDIPGHGPAAFHAGEYSDDEAERLLAVLCDQFPTPEPFAIDLAKSARPQVDIDGALAEWTATERRLNYLENNQGELAKALTVDPHNPIETTIYGNAHLIFPRWRLAIDAARGIASQRPAIASTVSGGSIEAVAVHPSTPITVSIVVDEANKTAMKLAEQNPAFVKGGVREWAEAIRKATGKTCSVATVRDTRLWQETMKVTGRGRTKGKSPKAVTLTDGLESVVGGGERHEILNRLTAEQKADYEPSPLDDDPPGTRRQPKHYKRV